MAIQRPTQPKCYLDKRRAKADETQKPTKMATDIDGNTHPHHQEINKLDGTREGQGAKLLGQTPDLHPPPPHRKNQRNLGEPHHHPALANLWQNHATLQKWYNNRSQKLPPHHLPTHLLQTQHSYFNRLYLYTSNRPKHNPTRAKRNPQKSTGL